MTQSKLSVVTAAFNAAGFLKECLQSVREQESQFPIEHIVIDGGSTDGTLKILQDSSATHHPTATNRVKPEQPGSQSQIHNPAVTDRARLERPGSECIIQNPESRIQNPKSPSPLHIQHPESRIQNPNSSSPLHIQNPKSKIQNPALLRFLSEPDQGQADAFNKGVAMATGDWICWLNADDMLAPGAIATFQRSLAANPKAEVIYGHVQFIKEDSSPAWISYHLPFFYPLLLNGCYVPPSSGTFFRRDLFLRQPLDIDYHYVMDVEWFIRCGRGLNAILVDQVFSNFRISDTAKTSEMIRSGQITDRHREERETYRRKYIYSQWPELTEAHARMKFERRQRFFLMLYRAMKMRYALRYLKNRKRF